MIYQPVKELRFTIGQRVVSQAEDFGYGYTLIVVAYNPYPCWDYLTEDSLNPGIVYCFNEYELVGALS